MSSVIEERNNQFGDAPVVARPSNAVATVAVEQQRAIAEVQASMMIARANPRDPIVAMDRILNACSRPALADAAVYTYARGGSDISGPSIRLAEAMAQSWGNLAFGIRELEQHAGMSTVQAFAWDVETNVRREVTFQVPHVRHTKKGSYRLEDPRDIYESVANNGARRLRACILAVIPGDVTEAAVNQCETTMKTKADTSPEAMQKMVVAFEPFGVTREQIETRIQRRLDAIQPAQVVSLKKIYASLRDGMSAPADWFDVAAPEEANTGAAQGSRTDAVKDKLRAGNKPDSDTPQTGGAQQGASVGAPTFAEITRTIEKAREIGMKDLATEADKEVALLQLEDVDASLSALSGEQLESAKKALAAVREEIKTKKVAGKK